MTYVNALVFFGEDMFDDFMSDFPFFDDRAMRKADRKLYGHHAKEPDED